MTKPKYPTLADIDRPRLVVITPDDYRVSYSRLFADDFKKYFLQKVTEKQLWHFDRISIRLERRKIK